jgi:hypothetical protein
MPIIITNFVRFQTSNYKLTNYMDFLNTYLIYLIPVFGLVGHCSL